MYRLKGRLGHTRVTSFVLPALLSITVTVSPVMAQNAVRVEKTPLPAIALGCQTGVEQARQALLREPITPPARCNNNSAVSHPILLNVSSASLAPLVLPVAQNPDESRPAGKNKPLIIAILIGAGIATVIALLLRGGGDHPPTREEVTVLSAGTPKVTTP